MNKDIQNRIAEIIDTICGGNKSEFCRRIGRDNSAVKDIIGGKGNAPGYYFLYDILSSDLGISPKWLMVGEGDMLEAQAAQSAPAVNIEHIHTVNIGNWSELVDLLRK